MITLYNNNDIGKTLQLCRLTDSPSSNPVHWSVICDIILEVNDVIDIEMGQ